MVDCEECGKDVSVADSEPSGVIIEHKNLAPYYIEEYGWCQEHRPEDIEEVAEQIKRGEYPD